MQFYNLTHAEQYRINGTLNAEAIESLLETSEALEKAQDITGQLSEALGCYPAEDFLAPFIDDLHKLAKRLRGDNREEALKLIESAEDLQQCVFNEGDYGRSELREARKTLEDVGL